MERPDWAPVGVDLEKPSAARVYDFYLGGFHNFEADRRMGRQAVEMWPELPQIMQANRAFLRRAVRFLVSCGIRQFLDLGSGIPTVGNVHEVAQEMAPESRVLYVDHDPVAVEHSRSILMDDDQTTAVHADLRDPDSVLADPAVGSLLDLTQPIAVLLVAVLHFISDDDDPTAVIRKYTDAVAPGSYLAISHASADGQPARAIEHVGLYHRRTSCTMTMRSRDQIAAFFTGWDVVEPGVVFVPLWRPDPGSPIEERPERLTGFAGVGHKP
ncbi:MAG: SAM-dependent methyltransferase [Angustibacter sp.]